MKRQDHLKELQKNNKTDSDESDYLFTKEDIALLEELRNKSLRGESKLYSWEEAMLIIKQSL